VKLLKCIEQLIEMEIEGAELYKEIEEVSLGHIEVIARNLKEEELLHAKELKQISEALPGYELLSEAELMNIEDFIIKTPVNRDKFISLTRKEFFTMALQMENDSIQLYDRLKETLKDRTLVYETLENLIEEERRHMYVILKMLHEIK
jgi:rubrerythrin